MIVLKNPSNHLAGKPEGRRYLRTPTMRLTSLWGLDDRLITRATMVDMSAAGACLELASEAVLPPHFTIRIKRRDGLNAHVVNCELVWQHEVIAGVRFRERPLTATS